MKKITLLLLIIIIGACSSKNEIQKPEKLIEKGEMENILYDLALLQALKSYSPQKLKENSINPKTYIYQKYKIDSAQFTQSNKYYASDINEYKLMFDNVSKRLQDQKSKLDTIAKKEKQIKDQKIKDSIKKAASKTNKKIAN